MRVIIIGGGAAGIGAAGAVANTDPEADFTVFTEFQDVGYSPCGIPFVHGNEIDRFEDLILQGKDFYRQRGFDIRYESRVERIDRRKRRVVLSDGSEEAYDRLVLATGFDYAPPNVPGSDLEGLYYVKNIRDAMAYDKRLDEAKVGVVTHATPIGVEMATAFAHRGLETHIFDPQPWIMADTADPDIMEPVEESYRELGVHLHLRTKVEGFVGDERGEVRAVKTSEGEFPADAVAVTTEKEPNNRLAADAGLKIGTTGGLIVDDRMQTSDKRIFAAGDCVEVPHALTKIPINGLLGTHAYAQGKVAGANAAGADRAYRAVRVPWGMMAAEWAIGGVSFGETLATALGIPFVMGKAQGISKARYYPGFKPVTVKLLADPKTYKLIGAQMVGGEGIKERADLLALAMQKEATIEDLAWMENVYSPPIGALAEPIASAAQALLADPKPGGAR